MPLLRKCRTCNKSFRTKPYWVKIGGGIYCSLHCKYQGTRKGKIVKCDTCGEEVYRQKRFIDRTKSGKLFCSKSCQTVWRNQEYSGTKHPNWKHGTSMYRSFLLKSKIEQKCRLCKTQDKRVLAVHHLDKNRQNNKLNNLVWLCHNCHFLVHHDSLEKLRLQNLLGLKK